MVEIIYYEAANKNKTIGYCDIRVPITKPTIITLRKVAHIQSGDRRWFTLPTFQRGPEGSPVYLRYFEFDTQVHNGQLLAEISPLVHAYCENNGIMSIEPMSFDTFPDISNESIPFYQNI